VKTQKIEMYIMSSKTFIFKFSILSLCS